MSDEFAAHLQAWAGDGSGAGLFVDFDGTLSPIVDDPAAAAPLPGAVEVLRSLAGRLAIVAVVSGRPASYLTDRLAGAGGVLLAGLYGLERVVDGRVVEADDARRWRAAVAQVADLAEEQAPPGVRVERKGSTVTLHVRAAPAAAGWAERFAADRAVATGLVAHSGKLSVELRPPSGGDKGSVVDELGAGLAATAFVGDDAGDLPAFEALARLRAQGVRTLAVAVNGDDAPAPLLDAADVVVSGPEAVLAGLRALLESL